MNKQVSNLLILLTSWTSIFLLLMAGLELFCRIKPPKEIMRDKEVKLYFGMMEEDPKLLRKLKNNFSTTIMQTPDILFHVESNSKGLRDREFTYERNDPQTIRVLAIGDSFTFGYGVEIDRSFPKLLEQNLQQKFPSRKVEVINGAMTGWGTIQEKIFLEDELLKYKPDVILVGFFINDVLDNYITSRTGYDEGLRRFFVHKQQKENFIRKHGDLFSKLNLILEEKSLAYSYLRIKTSQLETFYESKLQNTLGRINTPSFEDDNAPAGGLSIIDTTKKVTNDIKITSWQIFSLAEQNNVQLKVWRPNPPNQLNRHWTAVDVSPPSQLKIGLNSFTLDRPLLAKTGDYLGFFTEKGQISRNALAEGNGQIYVAGNTDTISIGITDRSPTNGDYSFKVFFEYFEQQKDADADADADADSLDTKESITKNSGNILTDDYLALFYPHYHSNTLEALDITLATLKEIQHLGNSIGAKTIIVNLPDRYSTGKYECIKCEDLNKATQTLNTLFENSGITYINPVNVFRNTEGDLYISDGHFNNKGHEIVTNAINNDIYKLINTKLAEDKLKSAAEKKL